MGKSYYRVASMFAAVCMVVGFSVHAQEPESIELPPEPSAEELEIFEALSAGWGEEPASIEGLVDCFDYYTFQSVQVSVSPQQDVYQPGETVRFLGNIENENEHPVVDGMLFVRMTKVNEAIEDGNHIVDEFLPVSNIALNPKEQKEVSFEWNIPQGAVSGEYQAKFFFSVGKKFNLGGLPFSNEVTISSSHFTVESDAEGGVYFDRAETTVNGEEYHHIGNWPSVAAGEAATVVQPVVNDSGEDKTVEVAYELYWWDSLNESDLLDRTTETVTVPAGEAVPLEYTIASMEESVYYLKVTAVSGAETAIVNVRVTSNNARPRLNYPAITKFPIAAGEQFTLFSCFHDTTFGTEGKVSVTLTDREGQEAGRLAYEGLIPSAMSAGSVDLTAGKDYEYLELNAQLFNKEGTLVDSYKAVYDCSLFDRCKPEPIEPVTEDNSMENMILSIAVVLILVGVIAYVMVRRKQASPIIDNDNTNI